MSYTSPIPEAPALLSVTDVAARLNCSVSHVYSLINQGLLRCLKVGTTRGIRIAADDLALFLLESNGGGDE